MDDLKNIFKVVSVLLLGMAWFFFEFHLSDTDAKKKATYRDRTSQGV